MGALGDRQTAQAAALIAQRLDAESCVKRNRRAIGERRVSIRPAPDTMSYVTALLPVAQGVAVFASLVRCADTATAVGDTRSRGQLMADEFVKRITAPALDVPDADAGAILEPDEPGSIPAGVNLDIQLVMTDRTLFDGDREPAIVTGYGPIPAELACRMVYTADPKVKVFIRRLYTDPGSGQLITADSRRRTFSIPCGSSWWRATACVAPPGAAPLSAMPTTSGDMWTMGRPILPTGRDSVSAATTPRKRRAGGAGPTVTASEWS